MSKKEKYWLDINIKQIVMVGQSGIIEGEFLTVIKVKDSCIK
jgi:hypothetical protein